MRAGVSANVPSGIVVFSRADFSSLSCSRAYNPAILITLGYISLVPWRWQKDPESEWYGVLVADCVHSMPIANDIRAIVW